ncbi:MAG: hypothetical protein ABW098_17645 [Candidatus Thiodiazotropha sp.]
MWIFYKHLPRGVSIKEINKVTLRGTRPSWSLLPVIKKSAVKRTKIIRIKDLNNESTEYHAIVQVESHVLADTIIENLDGRTVNGLFLKPHRYHRRFPNRDRRMREQPISINEDRRKQDRRRHNLITRVLDIN